MLRWGCSLAALIAGALPQGAMAQQQPVPQTPAAGTVPQQTPAPAPAQDAEAQPSTGGSPAQVAPPEEAPPAESEGEVVVTGQLEGAVPGRTRPELQLGPEEISSYGASNVAELLNLLSAQIGSGSGRGDEQPVILLSGRRSSRNEIASLPSEAIQRVDILPEEVALRYGYSASQKVINVVLRRFYRALTSEIEGRAPTGGGNAGGRLNENIVMINRAGRFVIDAQYDQSSGILETERGVSRAGSALFDTRGNIAGLVTGGEVDPALSAVAGATVTVAGVPDAAAGGPQGLGAYAATANRANATDLQSYRTLVSPQRSLNLNGSYARTLSPKVGATATLNYTASENSGLQGLPDLTLRLPTGNPFSPFSRDVRLLRYYDGFGPLQRSADSQAFSAEGRLNGDGTPWAESWRWTIEADYQRNTSHSRQDARSLDPSPLQAQLDARNRAINPFAPIASDLIALRPDDRSNSRNMAAEIEATTNGTLLKLPAGNANLTLRASAETQRQAGRSIRSGVLTPSSAARDSASLRANIDLPITSRSLDVLDAIGDLSVNANFEVEELSDFGRLTSLGYGVNWAPVNPIRASVTWLRDNNAPRPADLANPLLVTPNVRAFDFVRGESVDITRITGGNPLLSSDTRNVFNARVNIRPSIGGNANLNFIASYANQRFRNTIGGLPSASAEVEAAFPDRFTRDASGRLTAIDSRLVNFARRDYKELRFQLNFWKQLPSPSARRRQEQIGAFRAAMAESRRTGQPLPPEFAAQAEEFRRRASQESIFGSRGGPNRSQDSQGGQGGARPQGEGQRRGDGPGGQGPGGQRAGGGGRFGGGGGGGGFRGGGGGFGGGGGNGIRFNLAHVWVLKDELLIRPGLPVLDSLNGAPGSVRLSSFRGGGGGSSGGGTPRHQLQASGAINYESYLLQLETTWNSATFVSTGAIGSGTQLDFDSIARVNLTAQINFDRQFDTIRRIPLLRNTRVTLGIDNLFNARQRVTDPSGATPSNYDPRLLDPLGRLVRVTLRKQLN
jgi:hypothetical protein